MVLDAGEMLWVQVGRGEGREKVGSLADVGRGVDVRIEFVVGSKVELGQWEADKARQCVAVDELRTVLHDDAIALVVEAGDEH